MSLLKLVDRFSFKQIFWFALIIGVVLTIPLTVILVQQETQLFSKAFFKPPPRVDLPRKPPPEEPIVIDSIAPFLGKEGDIVIIRGENFGTYPPEAFLKVSDVEVPEDHLVSWDNTRISFYLPTQATSGKISVGTGLHSVVWPRILTVYSPTTKTKIIHQGQNLLVAHASNVARVVYYNDQWDRFEEIIKSPITNKQEPAVLVPSLATDKLTWITLFNPNDVVLSFYVSPEEFGF